MINITYAQKPVPWKYVLILINLLKLWLCRIDFKVGLKGFFVFMFF